MLASTRCSTTKRRRRSAGCWPSSPTASPATAPPELSSVTRRAGGRASCRVIALWRVLDDHRVADRQTAGTDGRAVHAEARLALLGDRPEHPRVAVRALRVHVDHDAALVALVDPHGAAADPQDRPDPRVLGERPGQARGLLHGDVGAEPGDLE